MARITVHVDIDAHIDEVWKEAADLPSHAEWMADAESIEFLSDQRSGVGTRMRVATKVGPLRTNDLMEVTEWSEGRSIGVKHSGVVTGEGRFDLSSVAGGTRFSWTEDLTFPILLGGPVTAFFAKPVLGWIWKRNLTGLKQRLERS
jgi:carbon monoxide dehydrogenase subunit G